MNLLKAPETSRVSSKPPNSFFVFGERCSGTNFLTELVAKNTGLSLRNDMGWKHGFPVFQAVSPGTVTFVIVRNAFDWVRSVYGKPWHTSDRMRKLDFADFIRAPWDTVVDIGIYFGLDSSDDRIGAPLQLDRHPTDGTVFANVAALRSAKLTAQLGIGQRDMNSVLCTHEFVSAHPEKFIRMVRGAFALPDRNEVEVPKGHFGWEWPKDIRNVDLPPRSLPPKDRAFLLDQLDLELEAKVGYQYAVEGRVMAGQT